LFISTWTHVEYPTRAARWVGHENYIWVVHYVMTRDDDIDVDDMDDVQYVMTRDDDIDVDDMDAVHYVMTCDDT
jgi:hypothetical protein